MNMEHWWNDTDRGQQNRSARIKPCSNATLSTTNPTQIGVGLNQDFQVGNVVFNLFGQGMAPKKRDQLNVDERILMK
jgi:hypothetical protein